MLCSKNPMYRTCSKQFSHAFRTRIKIKTVGSNEDTSSVGNGTNDKLTHLPKALEKQKIPLTNYVFKTVVVQKGINKVKITSQLDEVLEKVDEL